MNPIIIFLVGYGAGAVSAGLVAGLLMALRNARRSEPSNNE
jgi:hypothetical protein